MSELDRRIDDARTRAPRRRALRRALAALAAPAMILAGILAGIAVGSADEIPSVLHEVGAGETLFSIAEKYYGDGYQWPRIHEVNAHLNPERLKVGQKVVVPFPSRTAAPAAPAAPSNGAVGFWGSGSAAASDEAAAPAPKPKAPPPSSDSGVTKNPEAAGPTRSWKDGMKDLFAIQWFGRPLPQIVLFVFGWFIIHCMVQGAFTWFAAHMAFVKDVSVKKAWRATVQSETLAALFISIVGIAGLGVIYVATAPPGRPVLSELLTIAEQYLSTSTGMALGGVGMLVLYLFLGIRFIPHGLGATGGQGVAVVFFSVFVPHLILLYMMGYRLGYF